LLTKLDVLMVFYSLAAAWQLPKKFGVGVTLQYVDAPYMRYGIVGCGMMGQEHIRNIALLAGARVAAMYEPDAAMRAQAAALVPDAVVHGELNALLDDPALDALVIASPNDCHMDQLERIAGGRHLPILVEKPLFTSPSDVARLQGMAVRLHRRLILRAEAGLKVAGAPCRVALLDPGASCELAGVALGLRVDEEQSAGQAAIDAARFVALARRAHPATAVALVDSLEDARRDWAQAATALLAADAAGAAQLAQGARAVARERAELARGALARLAGSDAGADPEAWRALLAGRDLGPQVLPLGW